MKSKTLYIIILLLVIVFLINRSHITDKYPVKKNPAIIPISDTSKHFIEVKYLQENFVPVSTTEVILTNNGALILNYSGNNFFAKRTDKLTLQDEEFKELRSLVMATNILALKDSYLCSDNPFANCPMDDSIEYLEFNINNQKKRIAIDMPVNLPKHLEETFNRMRDFRWRFYK